MKKLKVSFKIKLVALLVVIGNILGCSSDDSSNELDNDTVDDSILYSEVSNADVTTVAGSTEGDATGNYDEAQFSEPLGIVIGANGTIYVNDENNAKIKSISANGQVSVLYDANLNSDIFRFNALAIDKTNDNLYVATKGEIYRLSSTGSITYVAGILLGTILFPTDEELDKSFANISGMAVDSNGNIFAVDPDQSVIKKVIPSTGDVTVFAGGPNLGDVDGNGPAAVFNKITDITIDANDNLYVTDSHNHKIKKITPNADVTTFLGSTAGYSNGFGADARLRFPQGIDMDTDGNLYVSDFNDEVRKVTPNGELVRITGNQHGGSPGSLYVDGAYQDARFNRPNRLAVDTEGNILITDRLNHVIRKIEDPSN